MSEIINKRHLREAIRHLTELSHANAGKLHTFNTRIEDESAVDFSALWVNIFGLLRLPLQQDDVKRLAGELNASSGSGFGSRETQKHGLAVDGPQVSLLPGLGGVTTELMLSSLTYTTLETMLEIGFEHLNFNIETKLEKFVVCQEGESFKGDVIPIKQQDGKFGSLFLQIPLEGNHPCGSLILVQEDKETKLQFASNSSYSAAAVTGFHLNNKKQHYILQSGPTEATAVLIFSLVWTDYGNLARNLFSIGVFPEFLIATQEMKKALLPWEARELSNCKKKNMNIIGNDHAKFLCFPVSANQEKEQNVSLHNMVPSDLVVTRSLASIAFIDVHCACLNIKEYQHYVNRRRKLDQYDLSNRTIDTTEKLQITFQQSDFSPNTIKDGLFEAKVDPAENFLGDLTSYGYKKGCRQVSAPVIVIRPRNPRLVLTGLTTSNTSTVEVFLESLEGRLLNGYPNLYLMRHLATELKQVISVIENNNQNQSMFDCPSTLFSRLFDCCIQLKAQDLALRILSCVSNLKSVSEFLSDNQAESQTSAFVNFVSLTKSWVLFPEVLKRITDRLLEENNFSVAADIGLKLLDNEEFIGAEETFKCIERELDAITSSKSGRLKDAFHMWIVELAICLHEETEEKTVPNGFLKQMKYLLPSQLTSLVEHLESMSKHKNVICTNILIQLGHLIKQTNFSGYNPKQCLKILQVYGHLKEPELLNSLWTILCSRCASQKEIKDCLFCRILSEEKTPELRAELLNDLANVPVIKDALMSSMEKFKQFKGKQTTASVSDICGFIEYLECILLLETPAGIPSAAIVESYSGWLSRLGPVQLCNLSKALFKAKFADISDRSSVTRRIFEKLLKQIVNQEPVVIVKLLRGGQIAETFEHFAWFGDVAILKLFVDKLKSSTSNLHSKSTTLSQLISETLATKQGTNCDASSSHTFSRKVFNFLLLEWLESLLNVKQERQTSIAACFKVFAKAERHFIDSSDASIVLEWRELTNQLSVMETVEIVKDIFEDEMTEERPKLKKFPSCWHVFTELCNNLLLKLKPGELHKKLKAEHLICLMQCFFWAGDEKAIGDFCRLLCGISPDRRDLMDVHGLIIRHEKTLELAKSSAHGIFALSDLIDKRNQVLLERLYTDSSDGVAKRCRNNAYRNNIFEEDSESEEELEETVDEEAEEAEEIEMEEAEDEEVGDEELEDEELEDEELEDEEVGDEEVGDEEVGDVEVEDEETKCDEPGEDDGLSKTDRIQKEIDELRELRKLLLSSCLSGQVPSGKDTHPS